MKAYHTLVVGDSGEGKTTLMREAHDNFEGYSIWIDHDGVGGIDGRQGQRYDTVPSVAALRASDATRIRFVASDPVKALEAVRPDAKKVYDRTGYPVQVVVDETQGVMPEGDDYDSGNVLAQMLHEDRDAGLKVLMGTQDPQDIARKPTKQCKYMVWVGVPHPDHLGFARYHRMQDLEMPEERFKYAVFEKGSNFNWDVAYRGETKREYA